MSLQAETEHASSHGSAPEPPLHPRTPPSTSSGGLVRALSRMLLGGGAADAAAEDEDAESDGSVDDEVAIYAYYRDHAGSDRTHTHTVRCLGKRPQGPDM